MKKAGFALEIDILVECKRAPLQTANFWLWFPPGCVLLYISQGNLHDLFCSDIFYEIDNPYSSLPKTTKYSKSEEKMFCDIKVGTVNIQKYYFSWTTKSYPEMWSNWVEVDCFNLNTKLGLVYFGLLQTFNNFIFPLKPSTVNKEMWPKFFKPSFALVF